MPGGPDQAPHHLNSLEAGRTKVMMGCAGAGIVGAPQSFDGLMTAHDHVKTCRRKLTGRMVDKGEGGCLEGRGEEGRGTRVLAGISKLVGGLGTHWGARIRS